MATNSKPENKETQANTEAVNDNAPETKKADVKVGPTVVKRSERRANATVQQEDPEERIESALSRTEQFLYNNGKQMLMVLGAVVLITLIVLGYKYVYMANKAEKAGEAMFVAEQLFDENIYELALNGDGNNAGFLQIIDKFGSTPQANIAKHYAGVCYFKLGDLDNATYYLTKYKTTKGAPNEMINAQNFGQQGDIMVQKGDFQKAAELFKKAVDASDNSLTAPQYLQKLALTYSQLGKPADAKAAFERIVNEYPSSMEGREALKYIGAEEQK